MVDVENVRGKSGFELSHDELLERATHWAAHRHLGGAVSLVVDHGSLPSAFWLERQGLAVIFAGQRLKADDVIARDVSFATRQLRTDVLVVTADRELTQRCRAATRDSVNKLGIISPSSFIEDLARAQKENGGDGSAGGFPWAAAEEVALEETLPAAAAAGADAVESEIMEAEIALGGAVRDAEARLRRKRVSPRKRAKLRRQLASLKDRCSAQAGLGGPSAVQRAVAVPGAGLGEGMGRREQDRLLARWQYNLRLSGRRELTGDRVLLAERLRRRLDAAVESVAEPSPAGAGVRATPARAHALHATSLGGARRFSAAHAPSAPSDGGMGAAAPAEGIGAPQRSVPAWSAQSAVASAAAPAAATLPPPLRIVVVSDTHGFEAALTADASLLPWRPTEATAASSRAEAAAADASGGEVAAWRDAAAARPPGGSSGAANSAEAVAAMGLPLPEGDVLLHLGDFAVDGGARHRLEALERFDAWLSLQRFDHKLVLRGNHDPFNAAFPRSNATLITQPTLATIGGWTLSLVPFSRGGRLVVPPGDLIASHVPPKRILDRTYSGDRAGSSALRGAVERWTAPPPRVWLCGHIHEGRGCERVRFGGRGLHASRETLVINAANANSGRANRLVHGPVVLDLGAETASPVADSPDSPTEVAAAAANVAAVPAAVSPIRPKPVVPPEATGTGVQDRGGECGTEAAGALLLAVDLGLRSGASLFSADGELLRYEQLRFADETALREEAPQLIASWEADVNAAAAGQTSSAAAPRRWAITHVAIEGGDPPLWEAWGEAHGAAPLSVSADEWRRHLLTRKERSSGSCAKAAARLVARQVVADFGAMEAHVGAFKTDAAEAVLMGYYVAYRLGWTTREPPIRRFSNGNVVLPKRTAKK